MTKFLLFLLLWRLTRNPILALLVLIAIYWYIDARYVGLLPNIATPIRRQLRASALRKQIAVNPHDTPAKMDLVRTYIEQHRYNQALELISGMPITMQEDPDVLYYHGVCHLRVNRVESGMALIKQALAKTPGLAYGEPYLELAKALTKRSPEEARQYLEEYQSRNQSSCEALYEMGQVLTKLGKKAEAKLAYQRCLDTYKVLPSFRRRKERRYAWKARFRLMSNA